MLLKLKAHGIGNDVINWIEKWLTHRKQRVIVDGEISNWKSVLSGANHEIFDEVKKIFILLVEDGTVGLLWKVVEQVEQGQTRYADALLEHVYAMLLVEGKLSVDGLSKGNHVTSYLLLYQTRKSRKVVMPLSRQAS